MRQPDIRFRPRPSRFQRPTRFDPEAEDRIVTAVHSLLPEAFQAATPR